MIVLQGILQALILVLIYAAGFAIFLFGHPRISRYYQERRDKKYWQKCKKDYEKYLQQHRRKELHKKEMEKYPLFYWRETSGETPLKELTNGNP